MTALLCPPPPRRYVYGEDAEPFVFSFFADVSQSPAVIKAMLQAQHEVSCQAATWCCLVRTAR